MVILFQPSRTSMFGTLSPVFHLLFSQMAGQITAAKRANLAPFYSSVNSTYHQIREITSHATRNMQYDGRQMRMRWVIVGLLFFATTINYLDRAILGVILPEIRDKFHFGLPYYGWIQFFFQIAYAGGSLVGGYLLDRLGTRVGYGIAATLWSLAATLNAFAGGAFQFLMYRTVLGLGESANFPACSKAAAEWFPPDERATAMGIVNAGTNLANIFGPPLFIFIAFTFGWQACFAIMGGLGFLWLPFWFLTYRLPKQAGVTTATGAKLSISDVMKYKQAWGYGLAKFLTDPVWWFYLFWLPTYLTDVRRFTPGQRGRALMIVYSISAVGALLGGVVSSFLMKRGWTVGKARKMTMLFCAVVMPACTLGVVVQNAQFAVLLFGLATAAHQAWMTNLFIAPADVFPSQAVGSANGFGVCLGGLGGALFSGIIPGTVIPHVGYVPVLMGMSCFYIVAWFIIHRMMGNLEMVSLEINEARPASFAPSRA
jgi:ACS family hexuronate transporter-like MFS transporter